MEEILALIRERESARGPFDPKRPVAEPDLRRILAAGSWAPTAHNMQNFEIVIVDDPKVLEAIGRIKSPILMDFIKENYRQLSFSEAELAEKKTGILANRFPPAWLNPNATAEELAATERPLPTSPVMLFMVYDPGQRAPASEGDFLGIISLGCVTENMWLAAQSLGIAFHIVSSFGGGVVEQEVKRILDIPESLRVVYAIRLGYLMAEPSPALRVRREVEDFAHRNRYESKVM